MFLNHSIVFFAPLPLVECVVLQVIESKKQSFDGVEYVANLETMDVHELLKVCWTAC